MSQQVINVGTVANDGTGDPLRSAFVKVNANFAELYSLMPTDGSGNLIPAAPLNSPHFMGDPQATNPPFGDNDQSLATTGWVHNEYAPLASPHLTGDAQTTQVVADTNNSKTIANTEWVKKNFAHVDPSNPPPAGVDLSAYAPLASPHFTGVPTSTTAATSDNSVQVATTAYVQNAILGTGGGGGDPNQIPPTLAKFLGTVPAGRLSLQSKSPVMFGNITGATTIYYTPYNGVTIPIYNGTDMIVTRFDLVGGELSALVSDATHSPPAGVMTGKVYDWFVWNDVSVPATPVVRLSRGPEWTNVSTRSVGTAIERIKGIWVNSAVIPNGPAVQRGTYVGTTYCRTNGQLTWQWGGVNTPGRFHIWNAFNRINVGTTVLDDTYSWSVIAGDPIETWQMMNNKASNRCEAVFGLEEDGVSAVSSEVAGVVDAGSSIFFAIGKDWVTGDQAETSGEPGMFGYLAPGWTVNAFHTSTALGFHFWQCIERTDGTYTAYGYLVDNYSSGMLFNTRM